MDLRLVVVKPIILIAIANMDEKKMIKNFISYCIIYFFYF